MNGLRKDLGLAVEQRIQLHLRARGSLLERALAEHGDLIAAETLATSLATGSQAGEGLPEEAEWDLFELGETAGVQSLEASLRAV